MREDQPQRGRLKSSNTSYYCIRNSYSSSGKKSSKKKLTFKDLVLCQGADGIGIREELLEIQNLLKRRSDDKMAVNVASCARKCIQGSDCYLNFEP